MKQLNSLNDYLIKINRSTNKLEIYYKSDNSVLHKYYSIRPDFDSSNYVMYEKLKSMDCIYGGEKSPTPRGIFQVEKKNNGGVHQWLLSGIRSGEILWIFGDF